MKKIILILTLLTLTFNAVRAQTVFGFETATDTGATITETIDGITVTLSGDPDLELFPGNGYGGTTANVALTFNTITSVTFTFNQPVVIHSIIPIEANGQSADYTFTPTGGSNLPVTRSLVSGETTPVNLNWVNVTSFTVTSSGAAFGFDELSVDTGTNGQTFFEWETANNSGGTITETVNGIGVTVSGDSSYSLTDYGSASGTSGNVVLSNANRTAITFTFDQTVVVNSILALEGSGADIDYTFTPTGGDNAPVTISLESGAGVAGLNWTSVTSFTVTSSGGQFGFDNLSVFGMQSSPTVFDFDTNAAYHLDGDCPTSNPSYYTDETIDGITVTFDDTGECSNVLPRDFGGAGGTSGYTVNKYIITGPVIYPVLVTFSEPVVVNSVLPFAYQPFVGNYDVDFMFTPIGGNNSSVTVTLVSGVSPLVHLNWINVTGFTVTPSLQTWMAFDNLSVNALESLSITDHQKTFGANVSPNPVEHTLYIKNISDLKSVTLYDLLGQQLLESKADIIDVDHLPQGMYLLRITTSQGMETKRIIKK